VNGFGFSAAFFFLAACALSALAIFWYAVPETGDYQPTKQEALRTKPIWHGARV
jgi:predicted MFS family arabinose efflux permease